MQITENIYSIPKVSGANSYVFISGENTIIIDTGMPGNATTIVDFVKSLGKKHDSITHIILTHPDIDHSGSVSKLRELTGAKVAIHKDDAPRLSGEAPTKEVKGGVGIIFKLMSPFFRFTPVKPDIILEDSDMIGGLKVIHTPGHTDGSICLYLPNVALFVGDALRTNKNGLPQLPPSMGTSDMEKAKDSIKKISQLDYSYLLPGHGPPIESDASTKMQKFVEEKQTGK